MKIGIDAMGGDNAPDEIIKGAVEYYKENPSVEIFLFGDDSIIKDRLSKLGFNSDAIKIVHTNSVVTMEDDPMVVVKEKNDSSISIGLQYLKQDQLDAYLSAGSTGAIHTASTLIVRKIKGIRRSAIAAIIPFEKPILLLDSGANPTVTEDILNQWAVVGSAYAGAMLGIDNPRVGLLNNGTEEHKGTDVARAAYQLLKNNNNINFVGNIESREIPNSPCDVLITDGFTGNVTLKLIEGMGSFMFLTLKGMFTKNLRTKMSYLLMKNHLKGLKKSFDASEYGGAPLLGLAKPVIKAHGSSKAKDIYSAIKQAVNYADSGLIQAVTDSMSR